MDRRSSIFVSLLLAAIPLGCTVGPNYSAPQSEIEAGFGVNATSQPSNLIESRMIAPRWWETLGDPTLSDLMSRVAASNLDVKIAQARVRQARAQLAYTS